MARSALFSCVQGKDRRYIEDALIASQGDVEIRFTGRQLNQDDHDLLMTLVFMAKDKPMGKWVTVPAYKVDTLRQLSGSRAKALRNFRAQLRIALDDLVSNHDIVEWNIDADDLVSVHRGKAISKSQIRHMGRKVSRT
jgi:hypothetical protein